MISQLKKILYIDDDADDRFLFDLAIKKLGKPAEVIYAGNGKEALGYLAGEKGKAGELPGLIVLDLNMPVMGGKETYEQIRADSLLEKIPAVVLSTGFKPSDKIYFEKLGTKMFTKPDELSSLEHTVSAILEYYRTT